MIIISLTIDRQLHGGMGGLYIDIGRGLKMKGHDDTEKDIDNTAFRGLLKCECKKCQCNMFVEEGTYIEQGGICVDCAEGNHEDIC